MTKAEIAAAKDYPTWIHRTKREWKARKRREWLAVLKAMDRFNVGNYILDSRP